MSQSSANLMVAVCDHVAFVKIKGRADFTSSVDLKKLIGELWHYGFTRFVFELCDCSMMDSTFLGMLAGIALKFVGAQSPPEPPIELVNANPRISEVLDNLGVAHLFKLTQNTPSMPANFEPLAKSPETTKAEVTRTCLEAHETLMGIQPENVKKFKDVAEFLAEDLKRLELAEKKQISFPD